MENYERIAKGSASTTGQRKTAYEKFSDTETVDVGLIIAGKCDATHIDNLITIAENRKDAIVFVSPERSDVVNIANANTQSKANAKTKASANAKAKVNANAKTKANANAKANAKANAHRENWRVSEERKCCK